MIVWLALGLVVLAVAAVVVMDRRRYVQSKARFVGLERRIDQSGRDHAEQLGQASRVFDERLGTVVWDLRAALEENKERGRVELTEEQIRDLRVTWGTLVCSSCGNVHGGLCPRVREVRYSPNGNYERILFWGDGRWELPEGTITPWDVFGVTVAPPPQKEETEEMTTPEEKAADVAEFVARLDVKPGDVVVMKAPADWGPEEIRAMASMLYGWSEGEELGIKWLVLPYGLEPSVVHTLTPDELAKAGAGDWPHEGRGGVIAGTTDDSAAESKSERNARLDGFL